MATGFAYHPDFLKHDTGPGHAERPERIRAILEGLESTGLLTRLTPISPKPATLEQVAAIHAREEIATVHEACANAPAAIDPDTIVSRDSYDVALLAAGAVLEACDAVMSGKVSNAFCAVRPPGHHAESRRAMGFCLFNNVAIAARHLQKKHDLKRILIVDWDVHHGNGTQEIFERDSSVMYFSTHQAPHYPFTGTRDEKGQGNIVNVPMPAGSGEKEFLDAFEKELLPAARAFNPDFVLISAGFDAHECDPLASLALTDDSYAKLTRIVARIARECAQGRLVSALEGGYDLNALSRSVAAHVDALMKESTA